MTKSQHSEDYKISAVKYYINNKVSMDEVCLIFECKKTSLKRSGLFTFKKENSLKFVFSMIGGGVGSITPDDAELPPQAVIKSALSNNIKPVLALIVLINLKMVMR